jgi:REP element-mobilizing transposase RayT
MNEKFNGKYRIASARLQNWDYGSDGAYFATICCKDRNHFFGECEDGKMKLSTEGAIVQGFWYEIPKHFPFVVLGEFIVMPNHIHGILILDKERYEMNMKQNDESNGESVETRQCLCLVSTTNTTKTLDETTTNNSPDMNKTFGQNRFQNQGKDTVSSIIGSYKSVCSKHIRKTFPSIEFGWQARFWDNIIRDGQSFENISQYIINNPKTWEDDKFFNSDETDDNEEL